MMVPATTAIGIANWRYAKVISGCRPRILDMTTVPIIPSSRLTAKQSKVPIKVTSKIRTGMPYQRDRGVLDGRGILLTYTIHSVEGEIGKIRPHSSRCDVLWFQRRASTGRPLVYKR